MAITRDRPTPQINPRTPAPVASSYPGEFATVRSFLPAMMRNIEFGAIGEAVCGTGNDPYSTGLYSPDRLS
ncbi:hypothetical protein [Nocardia arizonensis]|uniref:hypothetical protein n=1 Tax=Nocardia arizonensis TaxID=1141647 RepID=UPI0006CFEAAE|nr:hypothetical protein [Nocardia arizonensis]